MVPQGSVDLGLQNPKIQLQVPAGTNGVRFTFWQLNVVGLNAENPDNALFYRVLSRLPLSFM
jgi:hypothetical protein